MAKSFFEWIYDPALRGIAYTVIPFNKVSCINVNNLEVQKGTLYVAFYDEDAVILTGEAKDAFIDEYVAWLTEQDDA